MNKKSTRINLIFCGIAFIVMIFYVCFADGIENIIGSIQQLKPSFFLLAIFFMLMYWLLEAFSLHVVTKAINPGVKFSVTAVVSVIGQYFNCITPLASGGQPIQAYYMVKYGIPLGSSMTALLSKFICYQAVLTVYSAVVLILRIGYFRAEEPFVFFLVIVGFIVNTCVIMFLLMLAFFRRATTKIAHFIVRVCAKLHIIKDKDARIKFIDEELEMYYENFQFIKSHLGIVAKMCIISVFQLTFYFAISFVLYKGFGLSGTDFLTILSCQAFVLLISSFVPLPGAMGAAEGTYGIFFSPIFGDKVNVSNLIWRFLTFYLPIIIGMVVTLSVDRSQKSKEKSLGS